MVQKLRGSFSMARNKNRVSNFGWMKRRLFIYSICHFSSEIFSMNRLQPAPFLSSFHCCFYFRGTIYRRSTGNDQVFPIDRAIESVKREKVPQLQGCASCNSLSSFYLWIFIFIPRQFFQLEFFFQSAELLCQIVGIVIAEHSNHFDCVEWICDCFSDGLITWITRRLRWLKLN